MSLDFVGEWEGRWAVRRNREEELTAAERKRFLKSDEMIPLTLRGDGSFCHKKSVDGTWRLAKGILNLVPMLLDGHSLTSMRAAAEEQGRVFRLDFLFDPFSLVVEDECLATPDDRKLLYIRYTRLYRI